MPDCRIELRPEFVEPKFLQRHANGHRVTAPAVEMTGADRENFHEVESVQAPSRSLCKLALVPEHNGRTMIFPGYPTGDNANHAGMPVFVKQHQSCGIAKIFLHITLGTLGDETLYVLSLPVKIIEL